MRCLSILVLGLFGSMVCAGQSVAQTDTKEEQLLVGKLSRVVDGDTIELLSESGEKQEVHLEGIDAPEIRQDYGDESKRILQRLLKDAEIAIKWKEKDRYDRILGQLFVSGGKAEQGSESDEVHVNLAMIKAGAAWHFKRYNQSKELAAAEEAARKEKKGLWKKPNPEAPWDYRRNSER